MFKSIKIILPLLLPVLMPLAEVPGSASPNVSAKVRFIPMKWERLPDLNIPRGGHQAFVAGGEMVVVGGHTEGFVRTATAEYFQDGAWHTVKTFYPHDWGFGLKLADGDFLVGGGSSDDFGIGQTFGVERYNPSSHSFTSFPILDTRRTLCSAALLPSGEILLSGNWYADDAIALSDGVSPFETVQASSQNRSQPLVFTYGKRDAVIFSFLNHRGDSIPPLVDRFGGEPFTCDLLSEWTPWMDSNQMTRSEQMRVTDPDTGEVSYLFWGRNQEGQIAILRFCEGVFSKVETEAEIPSEGPWGDIAWYTLLHTDSKRGVALLGGLDRDYRCYLLSVDYRPMFNGGAAAIKVYYSSPNKDFCQGVNVILPDGRFASIGGVSNSCDPMCNYNPTARVFVFSPFEDASAKALPGRAWWPWGLLILALLIGISVVWLTLRRKEPEKEVDESNPRIPEAADREQLLYSQLCQIMETEELFKQPGLSLADVASRMRTNTKYISSCISVGAGCSFVEFVNTYRIKAAQKLLLQESGIRMNEVSEAVGFANESSFYRNFKNVEGCTPQQWLEKNRSL